MATADGDFMDDWSGLLREDAKSGDVYFDSYGHFGIHEEMLKDSVRTGNYQKAIMRNKHLFEGKVVLDVGSGTGILSLFAASAGAKKVIGIEMSSIIHKAREIVADNKMDHIIEFVHGKAEEVILPVDKVDIIVSEWMGYFLLYESMLDTVIFCRDKWLVPGGLVFPDVAELYIAAIEDADYREEKLEYWSSVYGYDLRSVRRSMIQEPVVDTVEREAVCTNQCCILSLDLNKCTKDDLTFVAPFTLKMKRKDYVHAWVAWFDVTFKAGHTPITFSTSPFNKYTHWRQTVFYLEDILLANNNETINGHIAVRKNSTNHRELDLKINYHFKGAISKASRTQFYCLR